MSKELPYFKFYPGEWMTGDITLCSMSSQGLFINICSYYWKKECSMSLANAKQRFSKDVASINELLEQSILKVDSDDNIIIKFLDDQMGEFVNISQKRANAGKTGGLAKAKQMLKFAKAKSSKGEGEGDKEGEGDNRKRKNVFIPPSLDEVKLYFIENGYKQEIAEKMYKSYSVAGWVDSKGNKIKNWKQKAINVWFTNENKIKEVPLSA